MPEKVRLNREQLHNLVWEKPTTKLAQELGISDSALEKICRKLNIPKPPVGYWAKMAAGQHPARLALPRLKKGDPDFVIVRGVHHLNTPADSADINREKIRVIPFDPDHLPAILRKAKDFA